MALKLANANFRAFFIYYTQKYQLKGLTQRLFCARLIMVLLFTIQTKEAIMPLETLFSILVIIVFGIPFLIGFVYVLAFVGGVVHSIYEWLYPIWKNAKEKKLREQEKLRYELEKPQREAEWKASEERYNLKKEAEKKAEQDRRNNLTPEERKREDDCKEEKKRKEKEERKRFDEYCRLENKLAKELGKFDDNKKD